LVVLKILVADDEFANLESLCSALEGAGHRVLKAGDGADALRIMTNQPCDIVVCDEDMPVIAGPQLVEAMKAITRLERIPVIMMAETFARGRAPFAAGATIVRKPVMLPQLLALIEQVHRDAIR
jgi:CheY-like chemotaxis protein